MVRDNSTLNKTSGFQMFSETFRKGDLPGSRVDGDSAQDRPAGQLSRHRRRHHRGHRVLTDPRSVAAEPPRDGHGQRAVGQDKTCAAVGALVSWGALGSVETRPLGTTRISSNSSFSTRVSLKDQGFSVSSNRNVCSPRGASAGFSNAGVFDCCGVGVRPRRKN